VEIKFKIIETYKHFSGSYVLSSVMVSVSYECYKNVKEGRFPVKLGKKDDFLT
jgi:hypothetical protein